MTKQQTTHPAVTGEERSYDSFDGDPVLQGHWVIYEVVSYVKRSGIPDRVIVRAITKPRRNTMCAALKKTISTIPDRAIGHVYICSLQEAEARRGRVFIPML